MTALLGAQAAWYLMRASGFVVFLLLTVTVCLGIANVTRWRRGRWTRALGAVLHRNVPLMACVFLAIHVLTAVTDNDVSIAASAVVVPGRSGYDPLWIGLGAVSLDLLAAVVVTSLLRTRLGRRAWRAVHWLAYAAWPIALAHAAGAGSGRGVDTGAAWSDAVYVVAGVAVALAVAARVRVGRRRTELVVVPSTFPTAPHQAQRLSAAVAATHTAPVDRRRGHGSKGAGEQGSRLTLEAPGPERIGVRNG